MSLRMKNFNILGFHWKIQLLGGGGVHEKPGGAGQERGGGVFEGAVDTPMHTMST